MIREPQKAFVAMSMCEDEDSFIGVYRLNQHLLYAALTVHSPRAEILAAASTIAGIGNELDCGERNNSHSIAGYTGLLFSCIAKLSANEHVAESIERINDSLRCIRAREHEQLDDVAGELIHL